MNGTDTIQAARDDLTRLMSEAGWTYLWLCLRFGRRVLSWDGDRNPIPPALETLNEDQLRQFAYLLRTNVLGAKG